MASHFRQRRGSDGLRRRWWWRYRHGWGGRGHGGRRSRRAWRGALSVLAHAIALTIEIFRALCMAQRRNEKDRARSEHTQPRDRKSTRLNSSHGYISYAVF